jgi:very-short-patch-repair endonuclease
MKNNFPRQKVPPEIKRKMVETARQFRKEPTKSEYLLWQALRGKQLDGIKFRRQQPIGNFIVDFYNSEYRLVIEIDGSVHDDQVEYDLARQNVLEELGPNILRIKAEAVEKNLLTVLAEIRKKIEELRLKANTVSSPFIGEG